MDICMQPLFLRIIYYIKLFLNILRFVVPIALIIKCGMDLYKSLLDTNEKNGVKNLKNRIIAGVVVFLIPTLINLLMNLIEYVNGINSYNGISECWEFADLDYIEQLEKEGKIFVFRPSRKVKMSRVEKDPEKLQEMYDLGISDATESIKKLNKLNYTYLYNTENKVIYINDLNMYLIFGVSNKRFKTDLNYITINKIKDIQNLLDLIK